MINKNMTIAEISQFLLRQAGFDSITQEQMEKADLTGANKETADLTDVRFFDYDKIVGIVGISQELRS